MPTPLQILCGITPPPLPDEIVSVRFVQDRARIEVVWKSEADPEEVWARPTTVEAVLGEVGLDPSVWGLDSSALLREGDTLVEYIPLFHYAGGDAVAELFSPFDLQPTKTFKSSPHKHAPQDHANPQKLMQNQAPSTEMREFWLHAQGPAQLATPRAGFPQEGPGKWMLFVNREAIDETWERIRFALEAGLLGSSAKVSTARPNPNSSNPNKHVICIYTANAGDEEDVMRVREALRKLGFVGKIGYKPDEVTRQGLYQNKGNKQISKYWV